VPDPERPNVVLVVCDQLRRQATSLDPEPDPNVSTPALERLADEGTRFANACSTYPICVPTRFSLMTGEYAHSRFVPGIDWRMSTAEHTIADEFRAAGYETAMIGKWHLGGIHRHRHSEASFDAGYLQNRTPIPEPYRGGFEHWRGFELRNAPFDTAYFRDDETEPRTIDGYQTDGLFDVAERFVTEERDPDRPFFAVISVEPPHPPFEAPREYLEAVADRDLDLRENVPGLDPSTVPGSYERWGSPAEAGEDLFGSEYFSATLLDDLRAYYAMVENLDDNLGWFLDALETAGLRESTAVTFLSDHGEMMGSHGLTSKQHPYEESVGVPFVVSPPGGADCERGRTITAPTATEDWFPTLCGLAGIEPDPDLPGADLTPLVSGAREELDRRGVLLEFVAENRGGMPYDDAPWRGIRTERYKYTVRGGPRAGEPWQLFDLERDPYERENLVDDPDHEATARELHGLLRERLVATDDLYRLRPAFGHEGLRNVLE